MFPLFQEQTHRVSSITDSANIINWAVSSRNKTKFQLLLSMNSLKWSFLTSHLCRGPRSLLVIYFYNCNSYNSYNFKTPQFQAIFGS